MKMKTIGLVRSVSGYHNEMARVVRIGKNGIGEDVAQFGLKFFNINRIASMLTRNSGRFRCDSDSIEYHYAWSRNIKNRGVNVKWKRALDGWTTGEGTMFIHPKLVHKLEVWVIDKLNNILRTD